LIVALLLGAPLIGRRKPQLAQQVMALAASPFDDSPIPLIPFVASVMVPLTGARIARPADLNYGPDFEEKI